VGKTEASPINLFSGADRNLGREKTRQDQPEFTPDSNQIQFAQIFSGLALISKSEIIIAWTVK
jgi:hypothetical protein